MVPIPQSISARIDKIVGSEHRTLSGKGARQLQVDVKAKKKAAPNNSAAYGEPKRGRAFGAAPMNEEPLMGHL
jgi:hypothetical protein